MDTATFVKYAAGLFIHAICLFIEVVIGNGWDALSHAIIPVRSLRGDYSSAHECCPKF
jgi:hypothetical protein